MARISRDEWGLRLAEVTSLRGTCVRRAVGCVLTDDAGHVLATGYNGVPVGMTHCTEGTECLGAKSLPGEDLDLCWAIHAEQNALIQCSDARYIYTCYTTVEPCVHCVKMLMNTGCRRVVFRNKYPHKSKEIWDQRGQTFEWVHIPKPE